MRIAVWHNLPNGGGFRALYDQVQGLTARGHHLEIWCPESAERHQLPIDAIAPVHRFPFEAAWHAVVRNRSLKSAVVRYRETRKSLRQLEEYLEKCAAEIDAANFDVVLAHSSTLFYMHPLARFTKTPSAIYLHEIYRYLHEARPTLPWVAVPDPTYRWGSPGYWRNRAADLLDIQADRLVLREECRAAKEWDLILSNSYFSRESVVRAYGIDSRVCYLGINETAFRPISQTHGDYLVGLGRLCFSKGAHLVVKALAQIPRQLRPTLRWIANFAEPAYLSYCQKLAGQSDVTFVCQVRVSEDELVRQLQHAIALVYPAVLEPFGYAPLEANACGTPVIGIAEGGVRETVVDGYNGLLVADRQPENWADAIMRLVQSPQLRDRLSKQAVAWVREHWSMELAISRLEKELVQVVASGRRPKPVPSVYSESYEGTNDKLP